MTATSTTIELTVDGSIAVPYNIPGVSKIFICENAPLEELLFNRRLDALRFTHLCRQASIMFLRHLEPILSDKLQNTSELQFLSKGYYYWLHNAFETVYSANLPINFVATNRVVVGDSDAKIAVHYVNFDAANDILIIGDTVATGETICAGLSEYLRTNVVRTLIVLSFVGSLAGARRIQIFCEEHGIQVIFLYGLAAFGLAQNGFDLSFLNNETVTNQKYLARAHDVYAGLGISVAGWDFGSQAQAPRKYAALSRIEAHYWGLQDSAIFPDPVGLIDERTVQKERSAFVSRISDIKRIK